MRCEIINGVADVRLVRAEKLNAFDGAMSGTGLYGARFSGADALAYGFATFLADDPLQLALETAREIAAKSASWVLRMRSNVVAALKRRPGRIV